ncbi:MAG: prolipoprotein diacylglyceryl transferase [Bacteroidetes bacterium]|nr:MAG: prolipoprotein diacylglyceryl transferase [Bacteroidota bacterium]
MYPRVSDIINDFLGTDILLPVQTFGFFVAVAFMVAYFVLKWELSRMESLGYFPTRKQKVKVGGPIKLQEVLISLLVWALVGYKLGLMFEDYGSFARNPQAALLSTDGSALWAILFGAVGGGFRFYEYQKRKNTKAKTEEVTRGIRDELGAVLTIAFVAGILGAKIFHNLEYWDDFIANPIEALFSFSGLTFYGGLICAGLGIAWYIHKQGYEVLPFADAVAPALMLSYGVGRIGCQLAGDGDWGIPNPAPKPDWLSWLPDWMWAFDYPGNVIGAGEPIPGCTGEFCTHLVPPVFPTPFYEVLMSLLIFAILWSLRKRLKYWGQMFATFLFFNGLERFLIEKIRVNSKYHIFGAEITQAEIISALLMIAGIAMFILATTRWKKTGPPPASQSG